VPRKSPELDEVVAALANILRRGLPVSDVVDPVLLALRGVIARAVDPDDDGSRTAALDGVLRGQLARFPDPRYAESARALFGLPPAEPGQNLTVRRERAASAARHEVHHFRKRVEPRLLNQLAAALLADADRFTRSRVIAPRLAPVSRRQVVPADPFAWEVAEHEEALARLWAAVYVLRAELLAVERLLSLDADRRESTLHAVTAAWRWAQASIEAIDYAAAFGTGDADDTTAHNLVALAGWTPPMSIEHGARLRAAATDGADRAEFVAALHDDAELGAVWVDAFFASCGEPSMETTERRVS
jgi:hypothetical protein